MGWPMKHVVSITTHSCDVCKRIVRMDVPAEQEEHGDLWSVMTTPCRPHAEPDAEDRDSEELDVCGECCVAISGFISDRRAAAFAAKREANRGQ